MWQQLKKLNYLTALNMEELNCLKSARYWECLKRGDVKLKAGVEDLLRAIYRANKTCCVCTRSSEKEVSVIKRFLPVLQSIPDQNWFTRHTYSQPKPNPECYLLAVAHYTESINGSSCSSSANSAYDDDSDSDGDDNTVNNGNTCSPTIVIRNSGNNRESTFVNSGSSGGTNSISSGLKFIGFEDTPTGVETLLASKIIQPVLVSKVRYPEIEGFTKQGVIWCESFKDVLSSSPQM